MDRVIGVDEAGRAPLAGPVCVAGVILPKNHGITKLRDSKLMTAQMRERYYEQIKKKGEVYVAFASPAEIDRKGILVCIKHLMRKVIKDSGAPVALIDAVSINLLDLVQFAITRGDNMVDCIAAASVVAKVERDRLMQRLDQKYPGYGIAQHKGYPTKMHREAVRKFGMSKIHRRSFCKAS